jgi:protein-tyrosine phosphatase
LIDIHVHILPGIDDGARSADESLEMARRAGADGSAALVATPHVISGLYPNTRDTILEAVEQLNALLARQELPIKILPGAEYRIEPDLPDRFARGGLMTLNDSGRYLLVELPSSMIPAYTGRVVYELLLQGVVPVIAHPERNSGFTKDPSLLYDLIARGALAQVTAGSLTGLFGLTAAKAAQLFLEHGCAHFIASDAHSTRGRAPVLAEALTAAGGLLGEDGAECLVKANPHNAVQGKDIAASALKEIQKTRQGFIKRLFTRR